METAMATESAKNWFGAPPPDLTMVDRVRGTAWVYNMLKNFYVTRNDPFGVNNRVFPDIGMPHVLVGLQGTPDLDCRGYNPIDILDGEEATVAIVTGEGGATRDRNCNFIEVDPATGSMTEDEYDQAAYDLANFLHYVGDPGRQSASTLDSGSSGS